MIDTELVMFTSPTCAPCKMVKPTVDRLVEERGYTVRYVDIFAQPDVAEDMGVMATPTWVLLDSSESELRRSVGAMNRPNLIKFVEGI